MSEIERFSMTDPEVARCPFGYYAAMRRKHTVHRDPGTGFYWISTYDAVVRAAMDAQTFSSQSEVILKKRYRPRAQALRDAAGMCALDTLVTSDPPLHDDYRNVGLKLFTQQDVERLAPHVQAVVNELIDSFISRGEAGSCATSRRRCRAGSSARSSGCRAPIIRASRPGPTP
jgi:cytochrome P450